MKLIEKELAADIIGNEEFVCVDSDERLYEFNNKTYMLSADNELFELEGEILDEAAEIELNDESTDLQSLSEEV